MATRGQRNGSKPARGAPRTRAKALTRGRPDEVPESGEKAVEPRPGLKLRRVTIRNYKAIDELDLEIPAPRLPGEPDVLVIGSRNGVGKTSVLEACALAGLPHSGFHDPHGKLRRLVRAGQQRAEISHHIEFGDASFSRPIIEIDNSSISGGGSKPGMPASGSDFLSSWLGESADPLLAESVLYFHSYRRVSFGNIDIGSVRRHFHAPMMSMGSENVFKSSVVHALMSKSGLFEDVGGEDAELALTKLNEIMSRFAGVTIEKLRTSGGNAVELRVSPVDGGPSHSFDGLSSGQKEIISTLFLIWSYTHDDPGIVLIDEPELHLNAEWHAELVGALTEIAPHNQYILATHSEHVFASVSADRRVLIDAPARR